MDSRDYPSEYFYRGVKTRYVKTGEFRKPRRGEYYLSGHVQVAYEALADLRNEYWIMKETSNEQA